MVIHDTLDTVLLDDVAKEIAYLITHQESEEIDSPITSVLIHGGNGSLEYVTDKVREIIPRNYTLTSQQETPTKYDGVFSLGLDFYLERAIRS